MVEDITINVTNKFLSKKDRYLTETAVNEIIRRSEFKIYEETSPYNPDMYDNNQYILRIHKPEVDVVVKLQDVDKILAITQRCYHGNTYEGDFYNYCGDTIEQLLSLYEP